MRSRERAGPLGVGERDRQLLEALPGDASAHVLGDVRRAGQLAEISHAEAALTRTVRVGSAIAARAGPDSSPSSHQSRAWVSSRSAATARRHSQATSSASGKGSKKVSSVRARARIAPKRRAARGSIRTSRATGLPPRAIRPWTVA